MAKVDPNDLWTCDNCGVIRPGKWMQTVDHHQEGGPSLQQDYCSEHRRPYDTHTTTSGYNRYYREGTEVTEEGSPILRIIGARKSAGG